MSEQPPAMPRLEPDAPIIRADDYARVQSAEAHVQASEARAAAIIADAERVFQERAAAGFNEGYQTGLGQALEELVQLQETAAGLSSVIEAEAKELVLQATRRIVGELPDQDLVARMVEQSLETFRGHRELHILVSSRLAERLRPPLLAVAARALPSSIVYVEGDGMLEHRECLIESEQGFLRLDVDTLIDGLARAIDAGLARRNPARLPNDGPPNDGPSDGGQNDDGENGDAADADHRSQVEVNGALPAEAALAADKMGPGPAVQEPA